MKAYVKFKSGQDLIERYIAMDLKLRSLGYPSSIKLVDFTFYFRVSASVNIFPAIVGMEGDAFFEQDLLSSELVCISYWRE